MSKKTQLVKITDMSEAAQYMLSRVNALVPLHTTNLKITHHRDDAVFIQLRDQQLSLYTLARLVQQNPTLYFEIQARAPHYIELRCFCSEWLSEHEAKKRLPYIQTAYESQELNPESLLHCYLE